MLALYCILTRQEILWLMCANGEMAMTIQNPKWLFNSKQTDYVFIYHTFEVVMNDLPFLISI